MCCQVRRFFFFQAEDGIRYYKVTGVQTCALPISLAVQPGEILGVAGVAGNGQSALLRALAGRQGFTGTVRMGGREFTARRLLRSVEVGRAAGRGRVEISGGAGSIKKKKKNKESYE